MLRWQTSPVASSSLSSTSSPSLTCRRLPDEQLSDGTLIQNHTQTKHTYVQINEDLMVRPISLNMWVTGATGLSSDPQQAWITQRLVLHLDLDI